MRMSRFMSSVALATVVMAGTALVALTGAAHANSLINGSFEDPTGFVNNTGYGAVDTMLLSAPGDATMTGWTTIGGGSVLWAGPVSASFMGGLVASNGGYFLDLTGLTNACPTGGSTCAGVSQTVNTTLGQQYQLSFDFGGRGDSIPVSILASAGGSSQTFTTSAVTTSAAGWAIATLSFTGTGGPTVISLLGTYAGGSGLDLGLDNVSVTATPLPSTWTMLIAGFVGLGLLAYRGTKKNAVAFAAA
jgi:hypothetical protein